MKEVKKAPAKRASAKTTAARKPAAKAVAGDKSEASTKLAISPEERYRMIQEAAYYIAERHGFNGDSAYFWSQAEAEINSRFS